MKMTTSLVVSSSPLVLLVLVIVVGVPGVTPQYQQQPVRVAPGVPPQHYQAQGQVPPAHHIPQQQQHHVPQQHIPHQQQQQQLLQQQQQQQLLQQQQQLLLQQQQQAAAAAGLGGGAGAGGGGAGHHHGQHGGGPAGGMLDASNVLKEREHIQEHMDVPIDTSQMSEQELQFHYFKMHDADNNNKLDGCELVKSLIHWHDSSNHDPRAGHAIPEPKIFKDDELIQMIDPILQNDDKNRDGMIDYMEFSMAQANAAARAAAGGGGGGAGSH